MRVFAAGLAVALACAAFAADARAETITFSRNSSNAPVDVSSQLSVEVTSYSSTQVLFVLSNSGSTASSVCDVYWGPSDANLFGSTVTFDTSTTSSGVEFSNTASPGTPPGDWSIFAAADSDSPVGPKGVNVGESAGFLLTLLSGKDFDDVKDALLSGGLLMQLHVQAIGTSGQSDWFESVTPVPEPGTLALMAGGLGVGLLARRRRSRSARAA